MRSRICIRVPVSFGRHFASPVIQTLIATLSYSSAAVVAKFWSAAESFNSLLWCGGLPNIMFSTVWCHPGGTGSFVQMYSRSSA